MNNLTEYIKNITNSCVIEEKKKLYDLERLLEFTKILIGLKEANLKSLKFSLPHRNSLREISKSSSSKPSEEKTLDFIKACDQSAGLSTNNIVEKYREINIITTPRVVYRFVNVLLNDKKIRPMNEDRKRCRTYILNSDTTVDINHD